MPERLKRIGSDGQIEYVPDADVPAFVAQLERERARMRFNVVPGTERLSGAGYFSDRRRVERSLGEPDPRQLNIPGTETIEVLLAGLVACGRGLGRIGREIDDRKHWQGVLRAATTLAERIEPDGGDWRPLAEWLIDQVKTVACGPDVEPARPIQERAEALAILIMHGQRAGVPPNFLIRAGAVLEVLRAAWRKAQRGGA